MDIMRNKHDPLYSELYNLESVYRRRTIGIGNKTAKRKRKPKKKRKRKRKCIWPGCNNEATSCGLCKNCKIKHHKNNLLKVDTKIFNKEEIIELYKDVIKFAHKNKMEVDEATTWLIAEGLNSFERKEKK